MDWKFQRKIGETFARARQSVGITQQKLAGLARTRQANISRLERGIQNPSLDFLVRVAKALDREVCVILK